MSFGLCRNRRTRLDFCPAASYCVLVTEAQKLGDVIAERVRLYRKRKDWSVRQLAEECAKLGAPQLTPSSLANIERGQAEGAKRRRRQVEVEELIVLARALGVPPALLVFPVGQAGEVEVVPGQHTDPWTAMRWFTGEARFPSPYAPIGEAADGELAERYDDPEEGWEQGAAPTLLFRKHQRLIEEWWAIPPRLRRLPLSDAEKTVVRDAQWAETVEKLRRVREEMKRHGLTPPPFPADLEEEG